MLVTLTETNGTLSYRIDCNGCGLKDEHDRGPEGQLIFSHYTKQHAQDSAQCSECPNAVNILPIAPGIDLCPRCRAKSTQ